MITIQVPPETFRRCAIRIICAVREEHGWLAKVQSTPELLVDPYIVTARRSEFEPVCDTVERVLAEDAGSDFGEDHSL